MYSVSLQSLSVAHIARIAEQSISAITGSGMTVICLPHGAAKTPERMLHVIAGALSMASENFQEPCRKRSCVELRFLGAYLLKEYYPAISLKQLARHFGGQDHTTIMNSLTRARLLLETKDLIFCQKHFTVVKAIEKWLNEV